ncbi:MAG: glycoside hydrolase domain-containing protein [bacterium]
MDDPLAVPATAKSLERFLKLHAEKDFLTFPEKRENAIRLFDAIPEVWTNRTTEELGRLQVTAQPGEYVVFQIGVFTHRKALNDLKADWTDLRGSSVIKKSSITCFNLGGIDYQGRPFKKKVDVSQSHLQPLWFGVEVPKEAKGRYRMSVTIFAANALANSVEVELTVQGEQVKNYGFDRGKSLSRLAWLNSTLGSEEKPALGFKTPRRKGKVIEILGRTIEIGENGLPMRIASSFEPSNQFLLKNAQQLLSNPFRFIIVLDDGTELHLNPGTLKFTKKTPSAIAWTVTNTSPFVDLSCSGYLEFDGFIDYKLVLNPKKTMKVKDIRLEIPLCREKAAYMMGLNHEGSLRPSTWHWKWDTTKNQDMLWIGDVNGGLRIKWTAENYIRPLINIYYAYGSLQLPPSWGNGGNGGITVAEDANTVVVNAFSGSRVLTPGQTLHYNFELLVTPMKLIDPGVRWGDRYFHGGGTAARRKVAMADSVGANIINIHHAEDIYPFINYPYLDENVAALRNLANDAHAQSKRLKLYYTTREITKNLPEFWAFFSLNGEIIYPGPGNTCTTIINPKGPDEWLKKNLKERYIPAWLNPILEGPFAGALDLAVITTPDSRLNNFYIGGLDWMLSHLGIDGIYIDDSALDRVTVRRARMVIDRYRQNGRIDFHSWNHFNNLAGYTNCLNLYMDLLPYIDLVWIGEQRDYNRLPDHWLIEVSGIPYGVTGQMLNEGGNPWRGMVYGITNRPPWAGNPAEIWKFWDAYAIKSMKMIGYWDNNSPIKSDNDLVKATLYAGKERSIIAVAGWGKTDLQCTLKLDWNILGYDPLTSKISIPSIRDFQEAQTLSSLDQLTIPAGKGYLIIIENGGRKQ